MTPSYAFKTLLMSINLSLHIPAVVAADTLRGPVIATVVNVYDGDTLTVDAHPWPQVTMRVSVRINGIDTPEIRGNCPREMDRAQQAQHRTERLAGEQVTLSQIFLGKYAGRVVANVSTMNGTDIGQTLIEEGLARPYAGGPRSGWCKDAS
jgi:micrococcal nuclease